MCYNVNYLTKKRMDYAKRLGGRIRQSDLDMEFDFLETRTKGAYYVTGFDHPDLPVITNEVPDKLQLFSWGLIPFWVKNPVQAVDLSNKTLNARGEEMFEKPSFRNAAKNKRCLIMIDGFFEYHWHNGVSFPYYIKLKSNEPMMLGGLWESWHYEPENITRNTCSIVTSSANQLMGLIHNKPKASESGRMPLIIPEEFENEWLNCAGDPVDLKLTKELIRSFDDSLMEAYTVPKLKGKDGVGNLPNAIQKVIYPELRNFF